MARQFGQYSPAVPLGTTWNESLVLEDEHGAPNDITGYAVRAQIRVSVPSVASGQATDTPVVELTTAGFYEEGEAPTWPVVEAFEIPNGDDGLIVLELDPANTWLLSPDNGRRKLYWDIRLVNKETGVIVPVVTGKVPVIPAVTV